MPQLLPHLYGRNKSGHCKSGSAHYSLIRIWGGLRVALVFNIREQIHEALIGNIFQRCINPNQKKLDTTTYQYG